MSNHQFKTIDQCIDEAARQAATAYALPIPVIERFLRTGEETWDEEDASRPGLNWLKQSEVYTQAAKTALRVLLNLVSQMLPDEVRSIPRVTPETIRGRVEPMVNGLVPDDWQEAALRELAARIFVLNFQGVKAALEAELSTSYIKTAWQVLWMFLEDYRLRPADIDVPCDGLSGGTFAHVAWSGMHTKDPYADVIVHEGAHLLYYLKPAHFGLTARRGQERFVDVEFRHRRLFAFACEAYSRVFRQNDREARIIFAEKMRDGAFSFSTDHLEAVASLVLSAARARNGWGKRPRPSRND